MPKPDIDFEKELWDAANELRDTANELRGAVSENNYKNYILPLVFVKHLSERYEMVKEEVSGLLKDPKADYYTTKNADIKYMLEDEDDRNLGKVFVTDVDGYEWD